MHFFTFIIALLSLVYMTTALTNNEDQPVNNNDGHYNPQYNDPQYNARYNRNNNRYYNNRDFYQNRQYYERHFRNYKPDVVAPKAHIVDQEMKTPDVDGVYSFSYNTDNGIHADEHGVSLQTGTEEQKEVVEGSYSFVTPEGMHVLVRYTADENGFHPTITYGGVEGSQFAKRAQAAGVAVAHSN